MPKEPKQNINSFLKPLVEDLIELWNRQAFSMYTSSEKLSEVQFYVSLAIYQHMWFS